MWREVCAAAGCGAGRFDYLTIEWPGSLRGGRTAVGQGPWSGPGEGGMGRRCVQRRWSRLCQPWNVNVLFDARHARPRPDHPALMVMMVVLRSSSTPPSCSLPQPPTYPLPPLPCSLSLVCAPGISEPMQVAETFAMPLPASMAISLLAAGGDKKGKKGAAEGQAQPAQSAQRGKEASAAGGGVSGGKRAASVDGGGGGGSALAAPDEHCPGQCLGDFARLDTCVTVVDAGAFFDNLASIEELADRWAWLLAVCVCMYVCLAGCVCVHAYLAGCVCTHVCVAGCVRKHACGVELHAADTPSWLSCWRH